MKPTAETYAELQLVYDTFNEHLFESGLPECLITLQREKQAYGYFSPKRFVNRKGEKIDEIAMNPSYFAVVPLVEIFQTLCHEQVHLWQHHHGKPGRARYHNTQWAEKMESIGLMPSSTGMAGGLRTGDSVADYPIEGGRFLDVCKMLITRDFKISWYDRFSSPATVKVAQQQIVLAQTRDQVAISEDATLNATANLPGMSSSSIMPDMSEIPAMTGIEMVANPTDGNKSNRSRYSCECKINIWGKPGLNVLCGDCKQSFAERNGS